MFERTPPGFDKRVGERDVGLREKPFEKPRIDQFINGAVEVLDPTVNEKSWFYIDQSARSIEQEFGRNVWIERCRHFPREDTAREVVDDGMNVGTSSRHSCYTQAEEGTSRSLKLRL